MRTLITIAATAALAVSLTTIASENGKEGPLQTKEGITATVNFMSECAGFYDYMADLKHLATPDSKATIEHARNLARGARVAAAYLLYLEYSTKPGRPPKKLGDFFQYPDSLSQVERVRLAALAESQKNQVVKDKGDACNANLEFQQSVLQEMRDQSVER